MSLLPRTSGLRRKTYILKGSLMPSKHLLFSVYAWCLPIPFPNWSSQKLHGSGITIPILKMRHWGSESWNTSFKITQLLIGKVRIPTQIHLMLKFFELPGFLNQRAIPPEGCLCTHTTKVPWVQTDSWFLGLWAGPANKDMGITVPSRNKSNFSTRVQVDAMCF